MKTQSPLLGYNNNVRHKNRVFHIQTEDSGVKHPHIITHLFMDGGRILKSVKKSYAEHVGAEGMSELVRGMMKDQHKSMLIALRDGQYDHLVEDPKAVAAKAAQAAAASPVSSQAASGPASPAASPKAPPVAPGKAASVAPASAVAEARSRSSRVPPPGGGLVAPVIGAAARVPFEDAPATTRTPNQELTLDIDALERAAKDAETASPLFQRTGNDLPPPPKNLFRDKPTGGYRSVTPPAMDQVERDTPSNPPGKARTGSTPPRKSNAPPARNAPTSNRAPAAQAGAKAAVPASRPPAAAAKPNAQGATAGAAGTEARYAPARPAAIFGQSQSRPQTPSSIFGEDLISDKSLDEVILSYLAEDLEPTEKKSK